MDLAPAEFERVVEEALEELPAQFRNLLDNVVIVVEEEPSREERSNLTGDEELLGLYSGVSRIHRTHDMIAPLPDQIAIFRGPILRISRNRKEALRQIRQTVLHELGHYFGLDDHQMRD